MRVGHGHATFKGLVIVVDINKEVVSSGAQFSILRKEAFNYMDVEGYFSYSTP